MTINTMTAESQATSDLLMRAISPAKLQTTARPSAARSTATLADTRLRTAVATGRVAPTIARRAVQPALFNHHSTIQPIKTNTPTASKLSKRPLTARPAVVASPAVVTRPAVVTKPAVIARPAKLDLSTAVINRVELIHKDLFIAPATGQVTDRKGQGIYQAAVEIKSQTGTARQVLTGRDGRFTVRLLPGRYSAIVKKTGFSPARGAIAIPQRGASPVIQMKPLAEETLIIHLKQAATGEQPFTGSAKLSIEGSGKQQTMTVENQSRLSVALKPGQYTVTLASESAEQILPAARQTVEVRSRSTNQSGNNSLTFRLIAAPQISNPEIQLLGVVCRQVPACPA